MQPRMNSIVTSIGLSLLTLGASASPQEPATAPTASVATWPGFRGPVGTGFAPEAEPPVHWSETENVRWKVALDGKGHSSPVVWGERVFLTTALPVGDAFEPRIDDAPGAHDFVPVTHSHQYVALALRRSDGEVLWRRVLGEEIPHEGGHDTGSYASASPVVDGERVFAFFGSRGLFCLDHDGVVLWTADLGEMSTKHAHGEGSSPALFGDTLVVNWDHEGASAVVAFDAATGEERWRVARDEETSWATPIVTLVDGAAQVVVSGTNKIRAYELASGALVWECDGLSSNVVATPVVSNGLLIAGSSYERQAMVAIRLAGARGDISRSPHLVWVRRRSTPYVPSPLVLGDWLYFMNHYQGFLCRVALATGEEPERPLRIEELDEVFASPVAAQDRIYLVGRNGLTVVLRAGAPPKELARNTLADSFSATPALVDGELYLRGERFLYCIAVDEAEDSGG